MGVTSGLAAAKGSYTDAVAGSPLVVKHSNKDTMRSFMCANTTAAVKVSVRCDWHSSALDQYQTHSHVFVS